MLPKTKPFIVGVCYRPPKQSCFYDILSEINNNTNIFFEYECIVLGDFNTNVQSSKSCSLLKAFKQFCSCCNLSQLIKEPTRITDQSSTLIDLILVSNPDKICNSGVIQSGISDHNIIYCIFNWGNFIQYGGESILEY